MLNSILKLFHNFFEKPLKVAIVSYYYPFQKPSTNGVGTHTYNLVTSLAKLGCEVHVFSYAKKDAKYKVRIGNGKIFLHFLNSDFGFGLEDPITEKRIRYAFFENKVLNEFTYENSKRPFEIIHTHGWLTSSAFMIKHLFHIPWVHTVHALERNRLSLMTEEEKKLFKVTSWVEDTLADSDMMIAVSNSVKSEIMKAFKNSAKKIAVIPNGVNLDTFKPGKNDSRTVLTVSRFSKEKGVDMLPEIIERVLNANKSNQFIVVAQETKLPALQNIQKQLLALKEKYPKRFEWITSPISAKAVAEIYKKSGIYVQTSYYEASGLCILEAMASGNAIVATNVGGVPEVVGEAGILVEPEAKQISDSVIKLLESEKNRKKYGDMALQRSNQFNWELIVKKTFDLYNEIIEEKTQR